MTSKQEKIIEKLQRGSSLRWEDAVTLIRSFGGDVISGSGSHHSMWIPSTHGGIVQATIAKPHPKNELKHYQKKDLLKLLRTAGYLG